MQRLTPSHRKDVALRAGQAIKRQKLPAPTLPDSRQRVVRRQHGGRPRLLLVLLLATACSALWAPRRAQATYTSTATATSATMTSNTAADTLTITVSGGFLQHNRFGTDPGFNSASDFNSAVAGDQKLAASALTTLTIALGGGSGVHAIVLGTPASPARTLVTPITISGNGASTLNVDDSGSSVANTITSDTAFAGALGGIHGTGISINDMNVFPGGVFIKTGSAVDNVNLVSSFTGEAVTLNSSGGNDNVTIGNAGSAQNIGAPVTVTNPPAFTNLTVDDSANASSSRFVTLTATAATGLAPAAINYTTNDIASLTVNGGSVGNTFVVTSTIPGDTTTLNTGTSVDSTFVQGTAATSILTVNGQSGADGVAVSNAGTVQGIAGTVNIFNTFGLTNLVLDDSNDSAARTAAISNAATTGLAPAAINYAVTDINNLTIDGGSGGNTFTVSNTVSSAPNSVTTLNSGTGSDHVNVFATAATSNLNVNGQSGADVVTVGNTGNAQGIAGPVSITNAGLTTLTVDDSADATARTASLGTTAITGLTPAAINIESTAISNLTVNGGSGGNTFTVTGTIAGIPQALNSGTGNDTVNVLTTALNSTLTLNGQSGSDLVTIGTAGNAQGITGAVNVNNASGATSLTVDDSADTTARTATVNGTQVTNLAPAAISLGTGVPSLLAKAGTNNDIFNVAPAAATAFALDGGPGNDTLNMNLTGVTAAQFNSTSLGAGNITSSNRQTVSYVNMESVTPVNQAPTIAVPVAAQSTLENTPLALAAAGSNAISIGDPDSGANPVQLSLGVTNGTLSLNAAALAGLTFTSGNGTNNAALVCTGTITNIDAALNGMVFTPTNLFSGGAVLTISVNDQGFIGSGGALSATAALPITVTRAPRTLSISSSVAQLEGNSGVTTMPFTVTLAPVSGIAVTVNYATADGTATAPSDYAATNGTLTFAPGVTTQTINVPIAGDTLNELDETFTVTLRAPTNASIAAAGAVGTGTILNDDPLPSLSINDVNLLVAAVGSTPFPFTVTLSAASGRTVTVNYATAPGTAVAGEDYTTTTGTLTFAPGVTTQTITVPVLGEALSEAPATFTVNLSAATAATITRAIGTGTVVNPVAPALALKVVPSSFSQGAGESAAVATVSRNTDDTSKPVVVTLSSSNPLRAVPAIPTVTIAAGATSAQFVVDAIADKLSGAPPAVTITAAATGFAAATATLTVTSPNRPALSVTVRPARVLETAAATATVGTVTRNSSTTAALKVTLSSSKTAKATVPAFVTIPAKATSITFPITLHHNTSVDGPQRVTFTARATGLDAGTASLTVLDSESKLTASGHVTTSIAADAGLTGLSGATNLTGPAGVPAPPVLVGVPNAVVSISTGAVVRDVVTTDIKGAYSFTNLPAGTYTITVLHPGYTFAPVSRPVTLVAANATGLDFTGTVQTSLSGRAIRRLADGSRAGVAGITVLARSGHGAFTAHTDAKGHYQFTGLALDAYVVLPVLHGTSFVPATQTIVLTTATPSFMAADFVQGAADKVSPTAKVAVPVAGHFTVANQPTRATGSATDTGGAGVAFVTVALLRYSSATAATPTGFLNFNSGLFVPTASALTEKLAAGTTAWTLRGLPVLPAGFYGVRATATDAANNVGTSAVVRFSITAPATRTPTVTTSPAPASTVGLSTAATSVGTSSVNLRFSGALDPETAADAANYSATVDGEAVTVESAGYNATTHTVTLGLPEGALHAGAAITVSWTGLQDSLGRAVAGSAVVR